ncbi:hypothetical protein RBS60_15400 [Sinomonas sp. ASV486]|uniref:hypothetical protein n=1 Tax=Sinomonas sp. ASV486 TaxID=3051170 RepID=UPI0027DE91C1|nr:hypothetical protein [Sinomonas sp. ASV486]MDQ4491587.1 hypothetical protein [Sinomonas sp. ASV486]
MEEARNIDTLRAHPDARDKYFRPGADVIAGWAMNEGNESNGSGGILPDAPDLTGLTEIRVHGVGGFTPQEILGDPAPTTVWGDRIAGFYRTADDRGRHLEAYAWGGLTSRSLVRVLWTLLAPAMLANMAGWTGRRRAMPVEVEARMEPSTWAFRWCARLAALALTVSVAVMVTLPSLDTVAYQCLGQTGCRARLWVASWIDILAPRDLLGVRLVWGVVPSVVIAGLFVWLARVSRNRYERVEPPIDKDSLPEPSPLCAAAQRGGLRSPEFWSGRLWHSHLSRLHFTAAIAVAAGMLGWCVAEASELHGAPAAWAFGGLLLTVVELMALVFALARDEANQALSWTLLAAALVSLGAAVVGALLLPAGPYAPRSGVLPGIVTAVNAGWAYSIALLAPLVAQQVAAWLSRRRYERRRASASTEPAPAIPVFPWSAPVVLNAVALVLANGVLVSAALLVATWLGPVDYGKGPEDGCADPSTLCVPVAVLSVQTILVFGLGVVLIGLLLVAGLRLLVRAREGAVGLTGTLAPEYSKVPPPESGARPSALPAAAEAEAEAKREAWIYSALGPDADPRHPHREPPQWVRRISLVRVLAGSTPALAAALTIVIALGSLVGAVVFPAYVLLFAQKPPVLFATAIMALVGLLPVAYGFAARYALRDERKRRLLMVPFDVGTFFPRSFHPFAPPSYAERAVPDLTRRIWWIHDNGGRVVLSAHSQGSVIAAATLLRRSGRPDPKVGLVTFGAPLGKLNRWAFPSLFSDGLLRSLAAGRGGLAPVLWRNLYYETDYIGGPVESHWAASAFPGDDVIATGAVDACFLDPPSDKYVYGQPLPRILSHTGYWFDASLWREINAMCDRITPPD